MIKKYMIGFCMLIASIANAECRGKIDAGAIYLHLDVLESGKNVKSIDMGGVRGDATIVVYKGLSVKPMVLYGKGNDSYIVLGSLGIGQYIPITSSICILPSAGYSYSFMNTHLKMKGAPSFKIKEEFKSMGGYLALDFIYTINELFSISVTGQYGWSRIHTFLAGFGPFKSNSEGPSVAALLDYTLTPNWTINIGAAYNSSLSREKHGIRGAGAKIGTAYWF